MKKSRSNSGEEESVLAFLRGGSAVVDSLAQAEREGCASSTSRLDQSRIDQDLG
jgi:hypothetical protein